MKIYIAHSSSFNFKEELYNPIQLGFKNSKHKFTFPHLKSKKPFDSQQFFKSNCDLIIADVSFPSTGLGIEIGWADILKIPIIFIHKKDSKPSESLKVISNDFFEYSKPRDIVEIIQKTISKLSSK